MSAKKLPSQINSNSATTSKGTKRKVDDDQEGAEYLRRKHNFIKSTIRTDYQPDICKDYKETGFCGFGDSCKFLHDRTDYKHGWQLDQEYVKGQYKDEDDEKYLIKDSDDEEEEEDGIPVHCGICKQSYTDPIMTKCKHYFCSNCADKECIEKCFICEKPTSGIFKNAAKVISEKMATRQALKEPTEADDTDCSSGSDASNGRISLEDNLSDIDSLKDDD